MLAQPRRHCTANDSGRDRREEEAPSDPAIATVPIFSPLCGSFFRLTRRAAAYRTHIAARAHFTAGQSLGRIVAPFLDELAQHPNKPRVHADGRRTPKSHLQLPGQSSGFHIKVK